MTVRHLIELDHRPEASVCGPKCVHNRWHPHIAPILRVAPGDELEIVTRDASDGQIRPGMTVSDLDAVEFGRVHALTGPFHVEGAEPGDLLAVHVISICPAEYGFTATLPGRGLMPDLFPGPILAHWEIAGGCATSQQVPGVRIPGAPFMGILGVAPSIERLRSVNARERAAAEAGALIMPPSANGAKPDDASIFTEGWRTTAAHEVGGNMDIRQLVAGSTAYFPVDVPGALFSAGDGHFAQGDGETCGTAIEMGARLVVRLDLLKGAARDRRQTNPTFEVPAAALTVPSETRYFATTALSVRATGDVSPLDASLAARNAVAMMVDALEYDHGLTREQAYVVASVAGELRISSIVNVPHAQVSMLVPTNIFQN